jgi:DNA-binding transcriptional LysR family regulator
MNLRSIDLNLLVIFEAIIARRSISKAAQKVGVSQSAMSHALRRLRETFKDDLVRRGPNGMIPTARGLQLAESLLGPLMQIQSVVDEQSDFDPKTSRRCFSLRISDYLVGWLLPSLLARIRIEAPHVTLTVSHPLSPDTLDPDTDIHLFVCSSIVPRQGIRRERLFRDRFVVVFRRDHPAAPQRMTMKLFLSLPHLKVAQANSGSSQLDDVLARNGQARRIAVILPSFSGILSIIRNTDLCAVLPPSWLKLYGTPADFATAAVPISDFEFTIDQFSKSAHAQDAGLRWLRGLIVQEFHALRSAATSPDTPRTRRHKSRQRRNAVTRT